MNAELSVFINPETKPLHRIEALAFLIRLVQDGYGLDDTDIVSLAQFIWSQGNGNRWLAIGGVLILGTLAERYNTVAITWLFNLKRLASGEVRQAVTDYIEATEGLFDDFNLD